LLIFEEFRVNSLERETLIDITNEIRKIVRNSSVKEGICRIFIPHTTAGITINENADPSVKKDICNFLGKLIPKGSGLGYSYKHGEGNSDAHIKSTLTGHTVEILIHEKKLMLGTWQGIMFAEYDGPRNRRVFVQIQGE
jgi:secondary thiamine-phosphate synthase enzyme